MLMPWLLYTDIMSCTTHVMLSMGVLRCRHVKYGCFTSAPNVFGTKVKPLPNKTCLHSKIHQKNYHSIITSLSHKPINPI